MAMAMHCSRGQERNHCYLSLNYTKYSFHLLKTTKHKPAPGTGVMDEPQEVGLERAMSATTCDVFNELRLGGQLCDAVIEAEGRRFNAHKNILCGCSPYFR